MAVSGSASAASSSSDVPPYLNSSIFRLLYRLCHYPGVSPESGTTNLNGTKSTSSSSSTTGKN